MTSFSQFLLDTNEQDRLEIRLRNKWMIRIRWLYVILLTLVASATTYLAGGTTRTIMIYTALSSSGLVVNGLFWLAVQFKANAPVTYYKAIAALQVILDLGLASSVIYLQGGVTSRATLLYAVPVLISGILFSKPAAYVAATGSSLAYIATILAYPLMRDHPYSWDDLYVPMAFYPSLLLIIAAIITRFGALNATGERQRTYQQLLAMLRHQLHHPSSVIAAIIEMLEHSDNKDKWSAKDKEYLQQLKRENLRLNAMITNVLESVSEPVPAPLSHPKKVNLLQLLNEVALSCATGAKRLGDLKTNLPNESVELDAQPGQLRTALDNIVENAFHYSPKGTPVTVSLSRNSNKGTITVKVEDQGPGISKDEQKELFKLFTRLEEQEGIVGEDARKLYSAGLGLYVSKVIFERHHATMSIESKSGSGTSVIVIFKEELWLRPEFYT